MCNADIMLLPRIEGRISSLALLNGRKKKNPLLYLVFTTFNRLIFINKTLSTGF